MGEFPLWPLVASSTSQTTEVETRDGYTRMISKISCEGRRSEDGAWEGKMMGVQALVLDSPSSAVSQRPRPSADVMITVREEKAKEEKAGRTQHAAIAQSQGDGRKILVPPEGKRRKNSLRNAKDSTEQLRKRSGAGSSGNVNSDDGAAGRSATQFTVGTVGTNGAIFLRPVVRPNPQRPQPPSSAFPPVPSLKELDATANTQQNPKALPYNGQQSRLRPPRTSRHYNRTVSQNQQTLWSGTTPRTGHQRARSFSSVNEQPGAHGSDGLAYRVVIDRRDICRPKTADEGGPYNLQVSIPHYRLGTPHFSSRGTAILRSSAYTRTSATEDSESSLFSKGEYGKVFPVPPGMDSRSVASPSVHSLQTPPMSPQRTQRPSRRSHTCEEQSTPPSPRTHQPRGPITPAIYDVSILDSDDPSVVRYASTTGEITAATLPRIISQITSANFLDYDMLSDFFLTFRSYLSAHHLVAYLIARLEWAVNRGDEPGRIVRVRTFVALRHWILNYFMDDFVPDYSLRLTFCITLNKLCTSLRLRPGGGGGDLKIIHELRRCWKRTCALYWDIPEFCTDADLTDEVHPGGKVGSRAPFIAGARDNVGTLQSLASHADSTRKHFDSSGALDYRSVHIPPGNRIPPAQDDSEDTGRWGDPSTDYDGPISPLSDHSIQVLSCSFPAKTIRREQANPNRPSGAHPAPISVPSFRPIAKSTGQKRGRSGKVHKRSGSFSDALRDTRSFQALQTATCQSTHALTASSSAGSLIRGNLLAPGKPFVFDAVPTSLSEGSSSDKIISINLSGMIPGAVKPSLSPNPGMKKFIGSMRRAISNKRSLNHVPTGFGGSSPSVTSAMNKNTMVPLRSDSRVNISAKDSSKAADASASARVDLLAASVRENFERKLRQEADAKNQALESYHGVCGPSEVHLDQSMPVTNSSHAIVQRTETPRMQSGVTSGSHSIVIVNDIRPELPSMPGALVMSSSIGGHTRQSTSGLQSLEPGHPCSPGYNAQQPSDQTERFQPSKAVYSNTSPPNKQLIKNHIIAQAYPAPHSSVLARSRSLKSTRSGSLSLRKYASYQGAMNKQFAKDDSDVVIASNIASTSGTNIPIRDPPDRMLRRRPGGDLRAVHQVQDLEQLPRSKSTGSLNTNHSGSTVSSVLRHPNSLAKKSIRSIAPEPPRNVSSGAIMNHLRKAPLSLVQTHSSQPNLRPSFEAEVAKLAKIPDNDHDDGGIESTLLKLEGRFKERSPIDTPVLSLENDESPPSGNTTSHGPSVVPNQSGEDLLASQSAANTITQTSLQVDAALGNTGEQPKREGTSWFMSSPHDSLVTGSVQSAVRSEESYSSIPLLERGLSDDSVKRRKCSGGPLEVPIPQSLFTLSRSIGHEEETSGIIRPPHRSVVPASIAGDSFLLNEDEDFSDLSSELSMEDAGEANASKCTQTTFPLITSETVLSELGLFPHPLRHPPSPPPTTGEDNTLLKSQESQLLRGPPTPEPSPPTREVVHTSNHSHHSSKGSIVKASSPSRGFVRRQEICTHLPFILEYDSDLLAQQFTLIEKDALNEIDWRDLVDLRWRHTSPVIQDWVEFLDTEEPRGVEVVIARFNIIVKWALSECVLTLDLEERARVIVKYIHIAAHCRRYRNYATMYQLTIALLSTDCSRLTKSWALVPPAELQVLKGLEALVQPMRNFHNLRLEMETASPEEGCIPFIGIYTHDLMYNAQKPSQLPATGDGEPLVNFERYRTSANLVKSLLRLLEASSRYTFKPNEEVISKGLWMAALPDAEIRRLSKELE
ncbi:MAG: Guanine nucleotide exchange factor lte1 [Candelina submexicana]|nr:MAG: Guanine nucleotide exchange factor lte1 [Candelina submexicana]